MTHPNRSTEELGIKDYSVFLFNNPDALEQYKSMDNADEKFGFVHPCCSYPLSDLEIEVSV